MNYNINFSEQELSIVLRAVAEVQYKFAAPVIKKIEQSIKDSKKEVACKELEESYQKSTQGKASIMVAHTDEAVNTAVEVIKVGDTVVKNYGGGPYMKVEVADTNGDLTCSWEEEGKTQSATFVSGTVREVK